MKLNLVFIFLKKYFFIFFFLLALIFLNIIILIKNSQKLESLDYKINNLKSEIYKYEQRLEIINKNSSTNKKIELYTKLLNSLIPDKEDYFSIIYALDTLSKKTGFYINNYTLNISDSTSDRLKLTITGYGDYQAFINFLNEYNLSGKRLITSNMIQLNTEDINSAYKVFLTFYNKKVKLTGNLKSKSINEQMFSELEKIIKKISFTTEEKKNQDFEYPRKNNKNIF